MGVNPMAGRRPDTGKHRHRTADIRNVTVKNATGEM
jgi:hypothetical protein